MQDTDFTILTHVDSKLKSLNFFTIDRRLRKQVSEMLNAVQSKDFCSTNSSVRYLGTNASMLCSFYSIWLQQSAPYPIVQYLIDKINALKVLKEQGTSISYGGPKNGEYSLSMTVFADASHQNGHGQLCYLAGLLFGGLSSGSKFHTLAWNSHES